MSMNPAEMKPYDVLYPDFESELATTRRMLAVVLEGKNDWKPHEKSMSLGSLATHVAELPIFGVMIMTSTVMDFAVQKWTSPKAETAADRLAIFEERSSKMKGLLQAADWNTFGENWVLRFGEHVLMEGPRHLHVRAAITHIAHHRAQLGVYLRLLGIAIPGSYGPSADES